MRYLATTLAPGCLSIRAASDDWPPAAGEVVLVGVPPAVSRSEILAGRGHLVLAGSGAAVAATHDHYPCAGAP